jgi:mRNA interferase RelE/StbE
MTYKIAIENKALAELAILPKKIQRQIANKIDRLSTNARPSGCKVLKMGKSPLYRIRSGDYRIVYQIRENQVLILVVRIAHRKDVYKRL